MNSCCFLRLPESLVMIHLKDDNCLYASSYTQGKWDTAEKIAENVCGNISSNISTAGMTFVYTQDTDGNIVLHRNDGGAWKSTVILKSSSNILYNLKVYSLSSNNKTHLFYNIPADITGGLARYKIVSQELLDGKWGSHMTIDTAIDTGTVFDVKKIASNHHMFCYIKQSDGESNFGYKEFYAPDEWSDFKLLYKTPHIISDFSVIATKGSIHTVFIVNGPHRQLLYVNKTLQEASPPVLLFESAVIEKAVLFMHKEDIHVILSAGRLGNFSLTLYKGARAFSRPLRIQGSAETMKAEYASNHENESILIGNLFTDLRISGSALFLEDICSDFYPSHGIPVSQTREYTPEGAYGPENKRPKPSIDIDAQNELLAEKSRHISMLEKKLEESHREISDLNSRITELSLVLNKMSSDESGMTSGKLRAENVEKANTIAQLQNRIMQLQAELASANEGERKKERITVELKEHNDAPEAITHSTDETLSNFQEVTKVEE